MDDPFAEGWYLSAHALDRALDMAVDAEDIKDCIRQPARVWDAQKYPGCKFYAKGRIGLAVNPELKAVITVLWDQAWTKGRWDRDDISLSRDPEAEGE